MRDRTWPLWLTAGVIFLATGIAAAAPAVRPRVSVSAVLRREDVLKTRIDSELASQGKTARGYVADEVAAELTRSLPLFEFVAGPASDAAAELTVELSPLAERAWPNGEVGMKLVLQARGGGALSVGPIKVLEVELTTQDRITQRDWIRSRLTNLLAQWPKGLAEAVALIPIPIQASVGPGGVETPALYQDVNRGLGPDQAVFRVYLDENGARDLFRACNRQRLAGPFVDSLEGDCGTALAGGGRRKPRLPVPTGGWKWGQIFLVRFWSGL
jgi:hypothetical protein